MTVPGDTRRLIHNGLTHTHQAVEKGRLADVRPADDRYYCHTYFFFSN